MNAGLVINCVMLRVGGYTLCNVKPGGSDTLRNVKGGSDTLSNVNEGGSDTSVEC